MEIGKKVKIALDEARMEVLGAQVLIGFQFRSAFEAGFDTIPALSRYLDGVALVLMLTVLALLVFPGLYLRTVEHGNNSGRVLALVNRTSSWVLAPFAVGIGLNVGIVCERVWGPAGGIAAGAVVSGLAALFWYGMETRVSRREGDEERRMSERQRDQVEDTRLHEKIDAMLTEARVILPGVQALLGFQFAIVLTDAFERLDPAVKSVHGIALGFVSLSIILLIAPAAYHRLVYAGEDSEKFFRIGGLLITWSTIPLALGLSADVFVVATRIVSSPAAASAAAAFVLAMLVGCWHIVPLVARLR